MKNKHSVKALFLFFIVFILVFVPIYKKSHQVKSKSYNKVVVCPGDTLWRIAERYGNQDKDIRKTIYEIERLNDLNSVVIMPGQILLIPAN